MPFQGDNGSGLPLNGGFRAFVLPTGHQEANLPHVMWIGSGQDRLGGQRFSSSPESTVSTKETGVATFPVFRRQYKKQ